MIRTGTAMRALWWAIVLAAGLPGGFMAGTALAQGAGDIFAGFQAQSNAPIQVDADSLEIYETETQRIAIFEGAVEVRRGNTLIRASKITLYAPIDASSPEAFTRIEAIGGVYMRSGEQTVTGATAVVDMPSNQITITGEVVLAQGTNVITGDRLVVDLATGKARVEQKAGKRIRGVFTPGGS
ncbi:MAG: LptA/OstA family protein [Alphaproteobacteria bacterium]